MAKNPEEMANSMIGNLKEKTGKTLEQWLKVLQKSDAEKHGQIVKYLKSEHQVTHGYANLIAMKALEVEHLAPTEKDLVETQYSGKKAPMRPIYDAIIKMVMKFGKDLEVSPKKAYVSLRRGKQFAIIQPSTATRVDIGINLKGIEPAGRLEASGSFNSMVSHRVRVSDVGEIDKELEGWLRRAYDVA